MSEQSQPTPSTSRSPLSLIIGITLAVLLLVGAGAGATYAIFVAHSDNSAVRTMANVLPIPAGRVGAETILYRDYLKQRDTLSHFLNSPAAAAQELNVQLDASLESNVLEKMMHEAALAELAKQKNITISDAELRQYFTDVVTAASSTTPDIGVYLLDNFGWSEEDFRQNVLRPALLEEKLAVAMSSENQGDVNALALYLEERLQRKDAVRYLRF